MSSSSRMRRPIRALLIAVCVLAVAGCGGGGGGDKDAYEDGMRGVERRISEASSQASELEPDATPQERADQIRSQARALEAAADAAGKLDPPEEAAKAHAELVEALHAYAAIFAKLAGAALEEDSALQAKLLGQAGTVYDDLTAASKALDKLGYSFGSTTKQSGDDQ